MVLPAPRSHSGMGTSSKRIGISHVAPGASLRNSSIASVSSSFMYDFSRARDWSEKHARNTSAPDLIASLIFCFHWSPGASDFRSRQYGICAASSREHNLSTRFVSSPT